MVETIHKMIGESNMKKNIVSMVLSGTMLVSSVAFGMDFDPKFYVGAELQANRNKVANEFQGVKSVEGKPLFRKNGVGIGLFIGTRLNEFLGTELGYNFLGKTKESGTVTIGGVQVVNTTRNT